MTWEHVITADAHDTDIFNDTNHVARSNTWARTGSYSFKIEEPTYVTQSAYATLPVSSAATKYVAFGVYLDTASANSYWMAFREGSTYHVTLVFNTLTMTLEARLGNNTGTLLASASMSAVQFVDCYIYVHDSAGRVVVKDSAGTELIDYTGDTQNAGTGVIDLLRWNSYGVDNIMYVDDIAVRTDDYCGSGGNYALTVSGAGANTVWAASTGDNYACVDEIPATLTDYVSTDVSVNGTKDNYAATALPITASSIAVVAVYALAQLDEAGSGSIRTTIKSSTSYGNGATTNLDTTAIWVKGFFDTDPATSAAWVQENLDDAQPGIETVA